MTAIPPDAATGYDHGPLVFDGSPFAPGWEQSPALDNHPHLWERCLRVWLDDEGNVLRWEPVVRCRVCRCPRCGSSVDPDPCMERRHHAGLHITLGGRFEPVGGYLPPEDPS